MSEPPSGWTRLSLSDLAEVRLGRQRSPSRAMGDHMCPYLRAANVTWAGLNLDDVKEMDFTPKEQETYRLIRGDILMSEASGSPGEVGKPALWNSEIPGACFQNTLIRVRPSAGLSKYLFWHLMADARLGRFADAAPGVGIHHLGAARASAWPINLAPNGDRQEIVDEVEKQLSRIDVGVTALDRVHANLQRYRASVLKAACEGRLVPTEAELARRERRDYEPADVLLKRILVERRKRWEDAEFAKLSVKGRTAEDDRWKRRYREPQPADTRRELPEGWCWATIDQVVENLDGMRVPVKRSERAKRKGPFPYYGASGIIDSVDDYIFDGMYLLVGEDGANLLARSTPIAFQAHGKFWVNNHAHVLRPMGGALLGYVAAFFNAIDLKPYVTGTAQPKLPQAAMNRIPIPLPPLAEQMRIVKQVEYSLSLCRELQDATMRNLQRAISLRNAILHAGFSGRLRLLG